MDPQYAYQSAPANAPFPPPMMPMLAQGGMPAAAQQLQGQGRGGDSMLVHMTPGEVKGLQALAMSQGQSLSINPTTGLPEANILKRFLPMILGAGLTVASGGALTPLMAAGIVGAGYGVAKGSLKEGLMAGLGAYGGAGLTSGLAGSAAASTAGAGAAPSAYQSALSNLGPAAESMSAAQVAGSAPLAQQAQIAGEGLKGLASSAGRAGFAANMPVGAGTASIISGLSALSQPAKGPEPDKSYQRPYEFAWNKQEDAFANPPKPGDTSERQYFNPTFTPLPIFQAAGGGDVSNPMDEMSQDGGYEAGGDVGVKALAKKRKSLRGDPYYKFAQDRRDTSMEAAVEQNFAKGGLPPRFLEGKGDGMSDSIKANIDGMQEARLADGEFVIPADVVSHLGNGSSKAGAKKLYAMMDKIRKARTGSKRQAPEVRAEKYMPA